MTAEKTRAKTPVGTGAAGLDDGTDAAASALFLPVTAVTCLEDRAQVERSGTVALDAGVQRLRIGPVTPLTVDRSLRAEITAPGGTGARVVDARVVRSYTPAPPSRPGPGASDLRREVLTLEREVREAEQARQRLESALAVVAQAKAELHRDIAQGAGAGDADPERWADRLERVDEEAETRTGELRRLRRRAHDLDEELRAARAALAATENEPPTLTAYVELVVETDAAGPASARVVNLVPCALWRPAYRATLAADRASVLLETDAFVWQDTGEDWDGVRLTLSTARPTLATSPPELTEDVLVLRDRTPEERRTVEVDLREEDVTTVGGDSPGGAAEDAGPRSGPLPGLDDGGSVRRLTAPGTVSVPSGRHPRRVHLSSFTADCRVEDTCAPELSPLVVTTAHFPNAAGHVLLAGPVDLVRGSGYVGRTTLPFAGAGEEVRLPFGSEDAFRVVRHVEEHRKTTGLSGLNQRTVITRTVRLFVSRLDDPGRDDHREVVIRERVPVSEVSAVEVRTVTGQCRPAPDGIDADGIVRYVQSLGGGERREIALTYEISASSAVTGL
ncbi:mucoidy inhibitor MuiA family protein [Streptomyces sp. HPF1205]|uniref:mucoidy inhibitor MuiA family protein n=1 Tax=Streptomyces sp. HPF1205 TaxID=2873262 RepID=UPI001CEE0434|nr:mucoidy inhibitor MuiA family protein [Streptomyces sp. HPF1205]